MITMLTIFHLVRILALNGTDISRSRVPAVNKVGFYAFLAAIDLPIFQIAIFINSLFFFSSQYLEKNCLRISCFQANTLTSWAPVFEVGGGGRLQLLVLNQSCAPTF